MHREARITLKGLSPYSAGKVFETRQKNDSETHDEFENRCWAERLNVDADGNGYIPGQAFSKSIQVAAKRFAGKIPGKGNATWSKFFESGIICLENFPLGVTRETVASERLFVPSDGVAGSGKRVFKNFPVVHKWGGTIMIMILEDSITKKIFEQVCGKAFSMVGLGRWRPERGGLFGRAEIISIEWSEVQ